MSENKKSATQYRGITIIIQDDGKYYTLGQHYRSMEEAEGKIDRYWDLDEESNECI